MNCWKETLLLLLLHISAIVYNFGKRKFRLDLAPPPALMGPLSSEKLSIILQWTPSDVSLFQTGLKFRADHFDRTEAGYVTTSLRAKIESPRKRKQSKMRGYNAEFYHPVPVGITERAAFKWATTYLSKIAVILRNAPNWMLTFTELMDRLMLLMSRDRKCLENNIRVCLSSHSCFTKVPVIPNSLNRKKNYWKLDCSQITAKMVRRHFNGLLLFFPELASKLEMEKLDRALPSPQPAPRRADPVRSEVKFTGPFSIESLLKRDSPPSQTSTASHLSGMEQQPLPTTPKRDFICYPVEPVILQSSNCFSHIGSAGGSTDHTLIANRVVEPIRWSPVHHHPSSPPYFTSAQHSFITYPAPT